MGRTLELEIFRYNPARPEVEPYMQTYFLEETPGMTVYIALNRLRAEQDPSLMFDFVCRAGICGSCGMIIKGILRMACRTQTGDLSTYIRIMPMPYFKIIGDLSVDTGVWFRQLNQKTRAWIHTREPFDENRGENKLDVEKAQHIYELERCIECGLCVAGCATAAGRADFIGAAGLNRIARFLLDPRDNRSPRDHYRILNTDAGAFGCFETVACEDNCPLKLPLDDHMVYVRTLWAQVEADISKQDNN